MAYQRKRKHVAFEEPQSKQSGQGDIQLQLRDFAKISKAKIVNGPVKKRKTVHEAEPTPASAVPQRAEKVENKRKRSLDDDEADDESADSLFKNARQNPALKQLLQNNAATPRSKRSKAYHPPSPTETPSKDTTALFDKMKLSAATKPIPFVFGTSQQPYDTPPATPPAAGYDPQHLPAELEELLMLQTGFLSALSLYYAHNGTSSPVDVKALLPMITKNWRKRAVSLDDLRTILAIPQGEAEYTLQEFGRAGICLTKTQPRGRGIKRVASFVDEVDLNAQFEEALQMRWRQWLAATPKENHDVAVFMDQLPLAEIAKHESVQHTAPLFARGQQRLADLKASQAAANSTPPKHVQVTATQKTDALIRNRSTSLLDRISAKQAHAASLPAGPSREQLERKSALHRIEDIERVLDLLAAGRPRCSFSMTAVAQKLQQSLRNPISREEVERCLGLMAGEITPGFVKLVQNGTVTAVVITKGGKVGLEQLRQRVSSAEA